MLMDARPLRTKLPGHYSVCAEDPVERRENGFTPI